MYIPNQGFKNFEQYKIFVFKSFGNKLTCTTKQTTTGIRTVNIRHLHVRYTSCLLVSTNMMDYNVYEMIYDRY